MAGSVPDHSSGALLPPTLARLLFRFGLAGFILTLVAYLALCLILARPDVLFAHARGNGTVTFHSMHPLPPEAETMADEVMAALAHSPLGQPDQAIDIWMVEEGWPVRLFFVGSPSASGLTYPVLSTSNVFLRYVDMERGLLSFEGMYVPPPRDLRYFLVHEITHLMLTERVGRLGIVDVPIWINEGFADYVALGPASPAMLRLAEMGHPLPRSDFGSYPMERVCVTQALEHFAGDITALTALDVGLGPDGACPALAQFGIAPTRPAS